MNNSLAEVHGACFGVVGKKNLTPPVTLLSVQIKYGGKGTYGLNSRQALRLVQWRKMPDMFRLKSDCRY